MGTDSGTFLFLVNETKAVIEVLEKHGADFDSERFCIYHIAKSVDTFLCDKDRVVNEALKERDEVINDLRSEIQSLKSDLHRFEDGLYT